MDSMLDQIEEDEEMLKIFFPLNDQFDPEEERKKLAALEMARERSCIKTMAGILVKQLLQDIDNAIKFYPELKKTDQMHELSRGEYNISTSRGR